MGLNKSKSRKAPADARENAARTRRSPTERSGPLADLVTMRMIILFGLMRRSGAIAQRRQFDLSETEWRVMTQVAEFAPLSLNGLAELLLLDRGQLSRAVKGMVERGLLTRERKPGGPEIEIDMTKRGRELHARMVERAIERDRVLTEGIPSEDLETLRCVINTMISRAEALMDEERELESP